MSLRCYLRALLIVSVSSFAASCFDSSSLELVVETFNVNLSGAYGPFGAERRRPIIDAIPTMGSDVVCLQEVWLREDREEIIASASLSYPHSASFDHDLDTPITDPTDQDGDVPARPESPPCATAELEALLDRTVDCLSESCSTDPELGDDARTTSVTCGRHSCFDSVQPEFMANTRSLRCYACVATSVPTATFGDMREVCRTDPRAELTFGGQSGVVVLSRHPILSSEVNVLPSTWSRRVVVSTVIDVPEVGHVDFHCAHLTPLFDAPIFPYTGDYGEGATNFTGWEVENLFQMERLVAWVNERSADDRAIIVGSMNVGREYERDSDLIVTDEGVPSYELLEANFALGVAEDYEPSCTMCPENPITGHVSNPVWVDHIFLKNISPAAVTSTERTFMEAFIEVEGLASEIPLSDHYGLRSTLELRDTAYLWTAM